MIQRYYLLLQDLVKHTSKDHPDYANLASAAQKVQSVAEYMNIKKREAGIYFYLKYLLFCNFFILFVTVKFFAICFSCVLQRIL